MGGLTSPKCSQGKILSESCFERSFTWFEMVMISNRKASKFLHAVIRNFCMLVFFFEPWTFFCRSHEMGWRTPQLHGHRYCQVNIGHTIQHFFVGICHFVTDKFNKILNQQKHSGLRFAWFLQILASLKSSNFKASLLTCVRILTLLATRLAFDNWMMFFVNLSRDVVVRNQEILSMEHSVEDMGNKYGINVSMDIGGGVLRTSWVETIITWWLMIGSSESWTGLKRQPILGAKRRKFGLCLLSLPKRESQVRWVFLLNLAASLGKDTGPGGVSWYPRCQECNREEIPRFPVCLTTNNADQEENNFRYVAFATQLETVF